MNESLGLKKIKGLTVLPRCVLCITEQVALELTLSTSLAKERESEPTQMDRGYSANILSLQRMS